jgi:hypothetical protein
MTGHELAKALGHHTKQLRLTGHDSENDARAFALAGGIDMEVYRARVLALCDDPDCLDAEDSVAILKAFADVNFERPCWLEDDEEWNGTHAYDPRDDGELFLALLHTAHARRDNLRAPEIAQLAFSAAIAGSKYENDLACGSWAGMVWDIVGRLPAKFFCEDTAGLPPNRVVSVRSQLHQWDLVADALSLPYDGPHGDNVAQLQVLAQLYVSVLKKNQSAR